MRVPWMLILAILALLILVPAVVFLGDIVMGRGAVSAETKEQAASAAMIMLTRSRIANETLGMPIQRGEVELTPTANEAVLTMKLQLKGATDTGQAVVSLKAPTFGQDKWEVTQCYLHPSKGPPILITE